MTKSSNSVSRNFTNQPAPAPISTAMVTGSGSPSPMLHQPDNGPLSRNAFTPPSNPAVSKNFVEAAKASKSANKKQGGATHAALRRPW